MNKIVSLKLSSDLTLTIVEMPSCTALYAKKYWNLIANRCLCEKRSSGFMLKNV